MRKDSKFILSFFSFFCRYVLINIKLSFSSFQDFKYLIGYWLLCLFQTESWLRIFILRMSGKDWVSHWFRPIYRTRSIAPPTNYLSPQNFSKKKSTFSQLLFDTFMKRRAQCSLFLAMNTLLVPRTVNFLWTEYYLYLLMYDCMAIIQFFHNLRWIYH